ncbi:metabotropic glycine receptor [Paramormyrops kingsleyae]|uniref:metabotropic glycine receptor n=1 Tax=Paramormyrops kingsleyae TaxID=1676925 RepID=UPI003B97A182
MVNFVQVCNCGDYVLTTSLDGAQSQALPYLYNGNATFLSLANCSKAYQLPGRQRPAGELSLLLRPAVDAITNAANFLNMIFQANDLRDSSIKDDLEWYHALVRGLLESDPLIRRALLAFDTQPSALQPQLVLQAKHPSYKSQDILLQDLSSAWQDLHASPPALEASWYTALKSSAQTPPTLSKRILFNDLNTLETPKWGRGDSYVTNRDEVHWASAPFLECDKGQFLPDWLLMLSTSFYGLKPDLSPEFRGVIRIDVSLQSFDVDQCAQRKDWFSNTHRCNRTTMHCEPVHGRGFRLGQYACLCKEGYYSLPLGTQNARVGEDGTANTGEALSPPVPACLPCWPGCKQCKDGAPCKVQGTRYLRLGVLAVQSLFMLLVLINMFVAYQFRQNKSIRASGLLLLETILFGSLLLYFPVFILYFKPSTFRCILLRWVRLMGFAMVYGTITLKMYRVLRVFLSRTAQRVPYMSSTHMLRLLGVIVLTVGWFLSAWTASVLQNRERNIPLLITSSTPEGKSFSLCDLDRWDYMMAVAELLFLCWGGSLHNSVRMIPSAFHESHYMGISIHNELLLSSAFHVTRFALPLLHPDWMLLLFFTHTHVTVSVTLGLLLIPKFLYMSQPIRKEMAAEVYEEEVDLQRSCSHFNSSFASAWNEHNMDSDDIRDELKKLYAQLEIHKTKKMSANNPHLPKKRSSHLGLGQSIMKHITRFPGSISRRCSREEVSQYSGGGSKPASCKKKILESGSIRSSEESFNKGVLLRCKSHSTYDRGQEHQLCTGDVKDSSLLNSSMRRKLTKKASESSEIKSEEAVPFVYKSASAHNLSADNQLLQPMPKKLQKSLSVMTSNMDGSALHPSMIYTADEGQHSSRPSQKESHPKHQLTISSQTLNAHLSELSNKAEVCFAENRSHKHVTYSIHPQNGQKSTERTESPLMQHNSPVEKLPCDFPLESIIWVQEDIMSKDQKKSEDRTGNTEGSDSGSEVAKAQLSASGSAPHSPITILAQPEELRVLSLCGTSCNSTKGLKRTSKCSGKDKGIFSEEEQEANVEMLISKSEDSVGYSSSSLLNSMMDNVVILRKDNNGMYIPVSHNLALHTQQRNTANIPPRKLQEETATQTTDTKERMQAELQNKARKQQSTYESVCPWETVNLQMIKRQTSIRTNICPWEVEEEPLFKDSKHISEGQGCTVQATMTNFKHENMVSKTDICPWEVSEAPQHSPKRQESIMADICPWETKEINPNSISISSDKQFNERLQEVEGGQELIPPAPHDAICPWGVQEEKSLLENIISPDIPSGQGEEMEIDAESEAEVFYFPEDL